MTARRWQRETETDRFGRSGIIYVRTDYTISDEGPAPWTLLRRGRAVAEFGNLKTAKATASKMIEAERADR
jgi:hypothetical protein